ncbi:MAG TPA: DUF1800 domain-containing protein [Alphaproteobacteria bacterium]|nr:DUF1800 domain-containing protein [Alphaproteobacteria bacterium]
MALDQAFIAATRFGLGPRPGDLGRIASDPRGWVLHQLDHPERAPAIAALPPPDAQISRFFALRREIKAQKQLARAETAPTPMMRRSTVDSPETEGGAAARPAKSPVAKLREPIRELYLAEAEARTRAAIESETPLVERLVAFWSNHFTVSIQRGEIAGLCGPFERQAIRPHVLGRFSDMLTAVMRHPAMLLYLDNARSIGPESFAGMRRHVGINENLGRELLELHTLGVKGGYTQADVIQMARMLTGWTIVPLEKPGAGAFRFEPRFHEPGPKTLLGVTYREAGMEEAQAALLALARHPATAHHVAEKLARHFMADAPPPAAVGRIAAVYQRTGGDLRAVTRAVVESPEAWRDPLAKVKAPQDFVVSTVRATGFTPPDMRALIASLRMLGQTPFAAPSPAGWPDTAAEWLGPEALMHRIEWSRAVARKIAPLVSAPQLAEATIGPVATPATMQTIATAANPVEKLTLVLASREFQRR